MTNNKVLKLGEIYMLKLTSGTIVSGILVGESENVIKDKIEVCYRLVITRTQHIDLSEDEIEQVMYSSGQLEKIEYFKEFEKKYGVKCFDSDDTLLPASVIMGDALIRKNIWDKLTETERIECIIRLELEDKDVVELVNVYTDERKRCKELHDKKMKLLDISMKCMNNFEKLKDMFPEMKSAYNLIYNELGIQKIIEEIC